MSSLVDLSKYEASGCLWFVQWAGLPMSNEIAQQNMVTCELRYAFNDKLVVIENPYLFIGEPL